MSAGTKPGRRADKRALIMLAWQLTGFWMKTFCRPAQSRGHRQTLLNFAFLLPIKDSIKKFTGNKYHRDSEKAKAFY
jgi:hypothetical protein